MSTLADIGGFIRGVSFDGDEAKYSPEKSHIPILRAGNIGQELCIDDDLVWVPNNRVTKQQLLKQNDIVICMASGSTAVLGKTAMCKRDFYGSIGAFCGIVRIHDADARYVSYWFQSRQFTIWRNNQARGVNIQNLRPNELMAIEISIPPLAEQKRIVNLLRRADRLRRLRRYARELAGGYLQSVFLEMFGDPVRNERGWEVVRVRDVAEKIDYGVTASASSSPLGPKFLRITDIQNGNVEWSSVPYCNISRTEQLSAKLEFGDIVFARTGATTGKSYMITRFPRDAVFASYLIRIKPNIKVSPFYLFGFFQTEAYWNQIDISSSGSAQQGVNASKLAEIKLPLPSIDNQIKYQTIVRKYTKHLNRLVEAEKLAEDLFQGLLAEAFG